MSLLHDLLFDYTLRTVALGSAMLGIIAGALGVFAVLRQQSLMGDAISHAALPGIALAFLLTGSKAPLVLLLGAALAGWLGMVVVMQIVQKTRIRYDSALGMILAVFFGFGLVLLTFIQSRPDATQAGLDTFLFGQAAGLLERDVITMTVLGAIALAILLIFWKECKILSFDETFGRSLGIPMRRVDLLLTTLLVVAIVLGLQTVGVVLMSAMLIAPAAAARQWTDSLSIMVGLSAVFGAVAGISGAVISSSTAHMPTGPTIVLCAGVFVIISLIFAPKRGLFWAWRTRRRNRRKLQLRGVLENLYHLSLQHPNPYHPHAQAVLNTMQVDAGGVQVSLEALRDLGWAEEAPTNHWALTQEGRLQAERMIQVETES